MIGGWMTVYGRNPVRGTSTFRLCRRRWTPLRRIELRSMERSWELYQVPALERSDTPPLFRLSTQSYPCRTVLMSLTTWLLRRLLLGTSTCWPNWQSNFRWSHRQVVSVHFHTTSLRQGTGFSSFRGRKNPMATSLSMPWALLARFSSQNLTSSTRSER